MDVTKPYKFIGFGAMDVTKPYKFVWFGAMDVTKPYQFVWFEHRRCSKTREPAEWTCILIRFRGGVHCCSGPVGPTNEPNKAQNTIDGAHKPPKNDPDRDCIDFAVPRRRIRTFQKVRRLECM
jgi:hypothetical protein